MSSGSKGFDLVDTDDVLCSYDDYSTHADHDLIPHASKEFHKTRMAGSLMFPTSTYISPEESSNNDIISSVERTMKKYTENIMRFLEGISSRLSQLELYCYNLDKSIGEMRSELVRDHQEADTKLKSLEKHLQEVHRSVQILRDKQELAKLQLAQKEPSSSAGHSLRYAEKTTPQASDTKNTDNTPDVRAQQLTLALPHQVAHQPPQQPIPPPPPQGVAPPQQYYLQTSQILNQSPQNQYLPSDSPYRTQQAPPQPQANQPPQSQYLSSDSPYRTQQAPPQPSQPQANQPPQLHSLPQYQQQWPQQAPQQATPMQPQLKPTASTDYPPYLPNQPANASQSETLPSSMPMQVCLNTDWVTNHVFLGEMGRWSKKMISQKLADLPPEIITDILTRLPVKTLIRFKCVSKSFLNLISNPQFIKTHLNLSCKDPNLAHFKLIFSSVQSHFDLKSCSLQKVLDCKSDLAVELDYPLRDPDNSVWIVGSFNGLVCIVVEEDDLFIWNPSTGVSKMLPDTGIDIPDGSFKVYGFGFDERIDDYKVVAMDCLDGDGDPYEIMTRVYSLKTDSWKSLGEFPIGLPLEEMGKFNHGSLHWAVVHQSVISGFKWSIVSLDLANETYGEIEQPNYGANAFHLTLGVLQGSICVLSNFKGVRSELWIMKEYGVRGSWMKLCSIPCVGDPGNFRYSFPFWISSNGEILMEFGASLVLYNTCDRSFRVPEVFNSNGFHEAATYVESLVAPNFDEPIVV